MDVSPSEKFAKNPEKAKVFYQHAHYVATSHVRSLKGLQIIKWNPDIISVNEEVQSHLFLVNVFIRIYFQLLNLLTHFF